MKTVLLLFTTTGYQTKSFLNAAEKLKLKIIPGSDRCHVLEDPWADKAIPLFFYDPEKSAKIISEYAEKNKIDAMIAIGDQTTLTAAKTSKILGLKYNSFKSVEAAANKHISKQLFKEAGLNAAGFKSYSINENPNKIIKEINFPVVLKPLSLSASRGVIRVNDKIEFEEAFKRLRALLKSPEVSVLRYRSLNKILIEKYIEGEEAALEGILTDGNLKVLAIFDKPEPLTGPFFEETIYITPTLYTKQLQEEIIRTAEKGIKAMGLKHGPIHAEFRLNKKGVWILEIAARPIGGLCARTLRFKFGRKIISLEELIIKHSLGEDIEGIEREKKSAGVMMIPIPKKGKLKSVEGIKDAKKIKYVEDIIITAKPNQILVPLPEGASYPGFIFARADSYILVNSALKKAYSKLRFDIVPGLDVILN